MKKMIISAIEVGETLPWFLVRNLMCLKYDKIVI